MSTINYIEFNYFKNRNYKQEIVNHERILELLQLEIKTTQRQSYFF